MRWPLSAVVSALFAFCLLVPVAAQAQRATINGTVVGPTGAPEANVTLIVTNEAGVDRRAVTDAAGAFVFGGLQPGAYRLRTDNDTFAPFSQDSIVLTAGQTLPLKIALAARVSATAAPTARAAVQGTVISPTGSPAGDITLIITNAEGIDRRVVTGTNGAFIFGGLQPGTYRLRIENAGADARPFPATELIFAPGERRQFDIRLQPLPPPPPVAPAATTKPATPPPPDAPGQRVATLPVAAKPEKKEKSGDLSYPVPEVTAPGGEFEAMPNRWDFKFPVYQRYPGNNRMPWIVGGPFDPYNQNAAKGDRPIGGSQSLFANVAMQLNSAVNPRQSMQAAGGTKDMFDNHNFVGSLELFRGDTVFEPKRWAVRATVVGNLNGQRGDVRTERLQTYGVEEAFVEKRLAVLNKAFDFMSVRAGMQNFNSDFRGFLFVDNQLGVRLFGNAGRNRAQYNVAYFDMRNRELFSQLHKFSSRGQRVIVANYYIQDFGAPGYTAMFNVHVNRDEGPPVKPGPQPPNSPGQPNNTGQPNPPAAAINPQQVTYLGFHGDGHWGSWSVNHAFYQAFGTTPGNNITKLLDPAAPAELKVNARMAAIELARDADWKRYRLSAFYASGDNRSDPATAKGFDNITDNPNFAGGQFMYWTQQFGGVRLGQTNTVLTEKFSLLPNLRSKFGTASNFVNPGLMLVNGGVDLRFSPSLKVVTNASWLRFADATMLRRLSSGFEDDAIGLDLSVGAKFRPFVNENMFIVLGYSKLMPQGGFKSHLGSKSQLHSIVGAVQLAY